MKEAWEIVDVMPFVDQTSNEYECTQLVLTRPI
jgi:hypothetical protein